MTRIDSRASALLAALVGLAIACGGGTPQPKLPTGGAGTDTGGAGAGPANPDPGTIDPFAGGGEREQPQPQELAFPDEEFRAQRPAAGEPRPFKLPGIHQFKLASGIQVYLVERHELPTVAIELTFPGGSINDPKGKEGMASVCAAMLSEGTEKLDKIAFEEALADIASSIGSYAGVEEQGVSMSTLTRNLDATLDLYVDTLLRPGMRQAEFDRMVKRRLDALKQAKGSAGSVAGRLDGAVAWGPEHAFGRIATEASYASLTLDDCKTYHQQYFKPKGAKLYVVGDMTEQQVRAAFDARLAGWKGAPKRTAKPGPARPPKGRIFFVDVPGSAQSSVQLLHEGPKRTAKDYFATMVMARVLGGGFSSRINMNLREDKGYAYGAGGGFGYNRWGSVFAARSSVQTDKTRESVVELHREVLRIASGEAPATDDEIGREKDGAILSLPSGFATARQVLSQYQSLIYYGLPLGYYDSYVASVQKVDAKQVNAAAKKHLKPKQLRALVVGDADSVLPGLLQLTADGTLGPGDLVILDVDGKVVETITPAQAKQRLAGG